MQSIFMPLLTVAQRQFNYHWFCCYLVEYQSNWINVYTILALLNDLLVKLSGIGNVMVIVTKRSMNFHRSNFIL